jgi:hypothetical protein
MTIRYRTTIRYPGKWYTVSGKMVSGTSLVYMLGDYKYVLATTHIGVDKLTRNGEVFK